ncbi:MAG: amino acid ABC transporter substrate-binding protein, partial [Chloroflexota bacterium]
YSGNCDAMTSDRSALIAQRALTDDPSAYRILGETLSKEPLGPVSPQGDPQFADIIRWTVWGMINAEEEGITSENIDSFMDSTDVDVQRLLGLNNTPSGSHLGIADDFMVQVIQQVGNYGEIYERHLGQNSPIGLDRNLNDLWINGGLIYAPPFGG